MTEANPFDPDEGDDETGADGGTGADSKNMQELRRYARAQKKEAEDARKASEEALSRVAAFENKEQAGKMVETLRGLGVTPDKAPEVLGTFGTSEEIKALVLESFAVAAPAPADPAAGDSGAAPAAPAAPAPGSEGFTPVTTGQAAPLQTLSLEDVDKLLRAGDTEAAQKAWDEGRVERLAKNEDGSIQIDWLEGRR